MIVKETENLEKLVVVSEMPPLPAAIGDVRIHRQELKKRFKAGKVHTKNNRLLQDWCEPEPATDVVVALLNRMWQERRQFLDMKEVKTDGVGGDLCPVQFGQSA